NTRLSQEQIVEEVKKKGILDSIMSGVKFESQIFQSNQNQSINNSKLHDSSTKQTPKFVNKNQEYTLPLNKVNVDPSKRHLYFQILNGKAFLEYLNQPDTDEQAILSGYSQQSFFTIYVHFRGQRF
ncbi:centrosomal of 76 kDa, partial [Brachionus plicatilis]